MKQGTPEQRAAAAAILWQARLMSRDELNIPMCDGVYYTWSANCEGAGEPGEPEDIPFWIEVAKLVDLHPKSYRRLQEETMPTNRELEQHRTVEQNHHEAVGVINALRWQLSSTESTMNYLVSLVPSGGIRNSITDVNIRLAQLRENLANISATMQGKGEQP